jgi:hypothetical protein
VAEAGRVEPKLKAFVQEARLEPEIPVWVFHFSPDSRAVVAFGERGPAGRMIGNAGGVPKCQQSASAPRRRGSFAVFQAGDDHPLLL